MIKLIASDVDGTILDNFVPSAYAVDVIQKIIDKGYYFVLTTGRNKKMCDDTIPIKGLSYILMNGSSIMINDKWIFESDFLDKLFLEELEDDYKKYNFKIWFLNNYHFPQLIDDINNKPKDIFGAEMYITSLKEIDDKYNKAELYFDNREQFYKYLEKPFNKKYDYVVSDKYMSIEIQQKGINKSNSLKKLCNYLNLNKDEVLVMGDSDNDLEMIKEFPYSVVPKNGIEKLKEIATYITDSASNDGVISFLEQNFL